MRQERERDAFCFASSLVSRILPDVCCVSAARYHVTAVIKLRDGKGIRKVGRKKQWKNKVGKHKLGCREKTKWIEKNP